MTPEFNSEALKRLVETSGVSFRQTSTSYVFECPKCEKKDKLYIRKRDGRFVCFRCKETDRFQGRPEWALRLLLNISIDTIRDYLYGVRQLAPGQSLGIELKDFYETDSDFVEDLPIELPEVYPDPDFVELGHPNFAKGLGYLESRGVTKDLIQRYQIKYHPSTARVIFPVIIDGKLRGWQGRTILPQVIPKILTTEGLSGGSTLMFSDLLEGDAMVLCEGPVDAIKAGTTLPAVASMGKAVTPRQLEILTRKGIKKIYIGFDPDAAGEITRIAQTLYGLEIYRVLPPPHREDLGDCSPAEVANAILQATEVRPGMVFMYLTDRWCR